MENVKMFMNSPKYGFKKGDIFPVLRTIMEDCVIITSEDAPNIVMSEGKLSRYGVLSGTPQLG